MENNIIKEDLQKKFILNDGLWKVMWSLSWPAIIAMVLYGMNTFIDGIFVGRVVGTTALAGVSVAYPLTQVIVGIGALIGTGAGSALSIAIGANDEKTQKKLMGNINLLVILLSAITMIFIFLFSKEFLFALGGRGEVLDIGNAYYRTTNIAAVFWTAGLAYNMLIRAEGKMKSAALIMGIGMIVNIFFNYIFIVVFDYGVVGAAWGTNIGMFVYTLLSWIYFSSGRASFKTKIMTIRVDKKVMKDIFSMGMPAFIMTIMSVLSALVVFNALAKYGTEFDVAIYGTCFRILTLLLTPIFGLMRALQPVIGINYGAKQYKRVMSAYKIFASFALAIIFPFWLYLMIGPHSALSLMMPGQELSQTVLTNFRIFMIVIPLLPLIFMGMTFFPAINKGGIASIIGLGRQVVLFIPLVIIIPRYYGVSGIYYSAFLTDITVGIIAIILVLKEFRKLSKEILKEKLT